MSSEPPEKKSPPNFLFPVASELLDEAGKEVPDLYHYTDQTGFLGILRTGSMWATMIQFLNDSREYEHGLQRIGRGLAVRLKDDQQLLSHLNSFMNEEHMRAWANPTVGIVSFSKKPDDLSQWRGYTPGSGGVCLGFDGTELMRRVNLGFGALVPVIYGNDEFPGAQAQVVEKFCEQFIADARQVGNTEEEHRVFQARVVTSLQVVASLLKDYSFRDEDEWRAIFVAPAGTRVKQSVRPGRSTLVPYYDAYLRDDAKNVKRLPLTKILLGPTPHERAAINAATVALSLHNELVPVEMTKVPFRNW